jgi:hypothetical protein
MPPPRLAAREPGIDLVAALLTTRNVDKGMGGATLAQRVEMLLALAVTQALAVLATNQARLADQSVALTQSFPGLEFDFVVGYDTLLRLFDERYYTDMAAELMPFFERHRLIATNRSHHAVDEVARFVRDHPVAQRHAARILVRALDDEPASYSSSASRITPPPEKTSRSCRPPWPSMCGATVFTGRASLEATTTNRPRGVVTSPEVTGHAPTVQGNTR